MQNSHPVPLPARALAVAISAVCLGNVHAQTNNTETQNLERHDAIVDEIIVTGSLQNSRADTTLPVNVLDGEVLREKAAATLGETLKELVGVNSASFGTGVGLPVIRGQSGSRVQVLQGGVSNIDAATISPDHANSVDAALAERIEVLRGPATLLYGNGAIGGVVNVIDNRIPRQVPATLEGLLETRHDTASDQQSSVLRLEGGAGQVAWHLDGTYREANDTRIKGFAINPKIVDLEDDEAHHELLDSRGHIDNSNSRAHALTAGASWIFSSGYIGAAVHSSRNNYGLPAAAHQHLEDEHDDHEEHEGSEEHEEHEEDAHGGIRIAMEQERADVEGQLRLDGLWESLQGKVSVVDYQHAEIEADGAIGTVYASDGVEGRFTMTQALRGNLRGVSGLQLGSKSLSATGEEAYIEDSDTDSIALFTVQSMELGDFIHEVGLRAEHHHLSLSGSNCEHSQSNVSGSASTIWRMQDDLNLLVSASHSQRAPSVEERYSNIDSSTCGAPADAHDLVAHAATQRIEIGDAHANKERSTNIELGLRRHFSGSAEGITGELNLFYNHVHDYLYMRDTDEFVHEVRVARMTQQDATFRGVEAELSIPLQLADGEPTTLVIFGDYVRATFDDVTGDRDVPRIPALRMGAELSHSHRNWLYRMRATHVSEQDDVAANETRTDGYVLVNASVDYHLPYAGGEFTLFGKISNLLDERVRNHVSLLKDVAPEAGRNVQIGVRFLF